MSKNVLLCLAPVLLAAAQGPVAAVSPFGSTTTAAPSGAVAAAAKPSPGSITIPRGRTIRVRLARAVDTRRSRPGELFSATLAAPITEDGAVVVPKGATVTGHVTTSRPSGRLRGRAYLGLTLDSINVNGHAHPISTSSVVRASGSHKKRNLGLIGGGGGLGAAIGAIAGGGKGALIGAGAGAAAGTIGAAATGKKNVRLPAESLLTFTLRQPVTL